MEDSISFRSFERGDYEMCCNWWRFWWGSCDRDPVARAFLPRDRRCYVIEKNGVEIACYFLFIMEPRVVGWTTYLVSNPKYKEKDRRDLINLLIQKVEKEAERYGIMQLFTVCGDRHMSKIHEDLNWTMIPVEHEGFKYIENNISKIRE